MTTLDIERPVAYERSIRLPYRLPAPSLRISECYFKQAPLDETVDVLACLFCDTPVPRWRSYQGWTRLIDLTQQPDEILKACSKTTRYEITRARSADDCSASIVVRPTDAQIRAFVEYYDAFAKSKAVPKCHPAQLHALGASGKLVLTEVRGAQRGVVASHAYVVGRERARLTHSASLFRTERETRERTRISRANRLLHWEDMVAFREMGMSTYDLGGWHTGSRDDSLLRINAFKGSFGGELAREWSAFRARSPLGAAYLRLRELAARART
jgi:hypothetical protein